MIAGYVPAIGETDLDKVIRAIRNLYENGAATGDLSVYLLITDAAATYLHITDAAATYAPLTLIVGKNIIINGDFRVNQRGYVSAATLASGSYGHDRWKGGSLGGDYSFTQLPNSTQITIAASKTLQQVVEDKNVAGGTYTLSWTGTCQARIGISGAATSGSYAASPITVVSAGAGQTITVEFGNGAATGTLGKVQLEPGSSATVFERRLYSTELVMCQRYFAASYDDGTAAATATHVGMVGGVNVYNTASHGHVVHLPQTMRAAPTISYWDGAGNTSKVSFYVNGAWTDNTAPTGFTIFNIGMKAFTTYQSSFDEALIHYQASAEL